MKKHTNVGYPYFKNDKSVVKPGLTYGQLVDKEARNLSPEQVVSYPFIAFGRNQRQKARPILGGSRLQALVYNQLEAEEIRAYKHNSPMFVGYNDRTVLRQMLAKMAAFLEKRPDLTAVNRDYSQYDTTVSPALKILNGALTSLKTLDSKGKQIAFFRTISTLDNYLINGLSMKLDRIYGRIFSGEIDTNAGGGKINALVTMSALFNCDLK